MHSAIPCLLSSFAISFSALHFFYSTDCSLSILSKKKNEIKKKPNTIQNVVYQVDILVNAQTILVYFSLFFCNIKIGYQKKPKEEGKKNYKKAMHSSEVYLLLIWLDKRKQLEQ